MTHHTEPRWNWISTELTAIIEHLRSLTDDGRSMVRDLTPLRVRLAALCGDLRAVPPDRRAEAQQGLNALLDLLDGVERRLEGHLDAVAAGAAAPPR